MDVCMNYFVSKSYNEDVASLQPLQPTCSKGRECKQKQKDK